MKSSIGPLLSCGLLALTLSTAAAADKTYTIAVIPKGTTHVFWRSVESGAKKAGQELGVKIIWKGPLREDDRAEEIKVVEQFTAQGVSGIVLAPLDSQALVKPVANAVAAGVPVVIMDSDLKSDKHLSFVATDNHKGGQLAGEHMGKLQRSACGDHSRRSGDFGSTYRPDLHQRDRRDPRQFHRRVGQG